MGLDHALRGRSLAQRRRAMSPVRCAAGAVLLALSLLGRGTATAAEPVTLPLSAEAQGQGELPRLLREALREYEQRLPVIRKLQWLEVKDSQSAERHWNEATGRFRAACQALDDACKPLVAGEMKLLDRSLRDTPEAERGAMSAVALSVIADLCASGFQPEGICGLNQRLHEAALRWLQEGNELLFAEYLNRYYAQRGQYLEWLKAEGQAPGPSTLAALPEMPPWYAAPGLEIQGRPGAARSDWTRAYTLGLQAPGSLLAPLALQHTARLSWRLGDAAVAREFEALHRAQYGGPATLDKPTAQCAEVVEAWRVDLARAAASAQFPPGPLEKLQALIKEGCGYTQAAVEFGSDALLLGDALTDLQRFEASSALALALEHCTAQSCSSYRRPQLEALLTVMKEMGSPAADTSQLLARRLDGLGQLGTLPESELRVDWAIGASLLRLPMYRRVALDLLLATQHAVLLSGEVDRSVSFEDQKERSRFDGLHRTIALAAVQQGLTLAASNIESLRGQTLLRRLRMQQLKTQLAGVHDAGADARYRQTASQVAQMKAQIASQPDNGAKDWVMRMADDELAAAELQRYEVLAFKRLGQQGERTSWLDRSVGLSAIERLDSKSRQAAASEADSLARDEAYLSWLQVPGGYVATVIACADADGSPQLRNVWIPVSPAQADAIKLYRDLLRTGSALPSTEAGSTLQLRGVPVWRSAAGRYSAEDAAPAGAQAVPSIQAMGRELHELLIAPLQAQWPLARRLVISPDGPLAQLPFESLWVDDHRQLLDAVDVSYVQSLAVHAELKRRVAAPTKAKAQQAMLTMADPRYEAPAMSPDATAALPEWMADLEWPRLEGTRRESDALLPLFSQHRQIVGPAAARATVLQMQKTGELAGYRVLHFATHGYVDDERSALVLAMVDGPQQAYLQDGDIAQLNLNSELVLLSACDTGLGRHQSGEGVMGLPYAFMLAGNTDTLMSLWSVDDQGTATFIPAFMAKARSGLDVVSALNATKREFAAGKFGEALRDPRIWAAFVLYGVPLKL